MCCGWVQTSPVCMLSYCGNPLCDVLGIQALVEITDLHIYKEIVRGNEEDNFLKG